MQLLKEYFKLQKQVYEYFGYEENWVVIPLHDETDAHWYLTGEGYDDEVIYWSDGKEEDYYSMEIYTQRYLKKWVYRAKDYTLICGNTGTDGNKFLTIFDNSKESDTHPEEDGV